MIVHGTCDSQTLPSFLAWEHTILWLDLYGFIVSETRVGWTAQHGTHHPLSGVHYLPLYCIAKTFEGENFHGLVKNMIFMEKTFTNSHKTAKVSSLESFPLYGSCLNEATWKQYQAKCTQWCSQCFRMFVAFVVSINPWFWIPRLRLDGMHIVKPLWKDRVQSADMPIQTLQRETCLTRLQSKQAVRFQETIKTQHDLSPRDLVL